MAINRISHITVFVDDQQAACDWYVDKLGFAVVMDNRDVVPNLRWLTVAPKGNSGVFVARTWRITLA